MKRNSRIRKLIRSANDALNRINIIPKAKRDIEVISGQIGREMEYSFACMQGWRKTMEDTMDYCCNLPDKLHSWRYFALFDGHGGRQVAEVCSERLLDVILETNEFKCLRKDKDRHRDINLICRGIIGGFLNFDQEILKYKGDMKSGSTAVMSFITDNYIILVNCGDSRALITSHGEPVKATNDHKPTVEIERERIVNAGGKVLFNMVNGSLALSRSLGDVDFKKPLYLHPRDQVVCPEPDVYFYPVIDEYYIILATDGIWDVFTNEELAQYIYDKGRSINPNLTNTAIKTLNKSLKNGSRDNMSVFIIRKKMRK